MPTSKQFLGLASGNGEEERAALPPQTNEKYRFRGIERARGKDVFGAVAQILDFFEKLVQK